MLLEFAGDGRASCGIPGTQFLQCLQTGFYAQVPRPKPAIIAFHGDPAIRRETPVNSATSRSFELRGRADLLQILSGKADKKD